MSRRVLAGKPLWRLMEWLSRGREFSVKPPTGFGQTTRSFGQGVAQNNILAVKWLLPAADHGDSDAQHVLGKLHEEGQGVARDYVRALVWYKLAAKSGDTGASVHIDRLKSLMIPAQIAEAESLICRSN